MENLKSENAKIEKFYSRKIESALYFDRVVIVQSL